MKILDRRVSLVEQPLDNGYILVTVITDLINGEDRRVILATVTQNITCKSYRDLGEFGITHDNAIGNKFQQFVTLYNRDGTTLNLGNVSWNNAVKIAMRERCLLGKLFNRFLYSKSKLYLR